MDSIKQETLISQFLTVIYGPGYGNENDANDGDGYGSGYGYGHGSGSGHGYGYGSGYSSGYGSGSGSGYGYGDGSGHGSGSGSGYGSGSGSGYGYGIKSINGKRVYYIDGIPAHIHHVKGNIARASQVRADLSLEPCYIVKSGHLFAHGESIKSAYAALDEKIFNDMDTDERIDSFLLCHEKGKAYPNADFFEWHGKLTYSCEFGRRAFIDERGIDLDGSMTVEEFIAITKDAYGGNVIRELESRVQ